MILSKLFERPFSYVQHRMNLRKAIRDWNYGHPNNGSPQIRNQWPVAVWTMLLKDKRITVEEIFDSEWKTGVLGIIREPAFWEAMAGHLDEGHPTWDSVTPYALRQGNVPCLDKIPATVLVAHIHMADTHPVSKKWFLEHPIYGINPAYRAMWRPLNFIPHIKEYFGGHTTAQDFLNIVRLNIELEGASSAVTALDSFIEILIQRNNSLMLIDRKPQSGLHANSKTHILMRDIWTLSESILPFEIICSVYGLKPLGRNIPHNVTQDALAILHYGVQQNWWDSTLIEPRDNTISQMDTYLNIALPSSKAELLEGMRHYYQYQQQSFEQVAWNTSFTEASSNLS